MSRIILHIREVNAVIPVLICLERSPYRSREKSRGEIPVDLIKLDIRLRNGMRIPGCVRPEDLTSNIEIRQELALFEDLEYWCGIGESAGDSLVAELACGSGRPREDSRGHGVHLVRSFEETNADRVEEQLCRKVKVRNRPEWPDCGLDRDSSVRNLRPVQGK